MIDRETLKALEEANPGSVVSDNNSGIVTLIGWTLNQYDNATQNHNDSQNIQGDTKETSLPRMPGQLSNNSPKVIMAKNGLKRMIDPLSDTPDNTVQGDRYGCSNGGSGKKSRSSQNKHEESCNNQNVVLGIKGKFRKWISWFRRVYRSKG